MAELKPCPFCGSKQVDVRKGKYLWWVECGNADCCGNGGGSKYKKEAIERWNRRAEDGK